MQFARQSAEDTNPFSTRERRTFLPLVNINCAYAEFLNSRCFQIIILTVVNSQKGIQTGLQHSFGTGFHTIAQVNLVAFNGRIDEFGVAHRRQTIHRIQRVEKTDLHGTHRTEATHRFFNANTLIRLEDLHNHSGVRRRDLEARRIGVSGRHSLLLRRLLGTACETEERNEKHDVPLTKSMRDKSHHRKNYFTTFLPPRLSMQK